MIDMLKSTKPIVGVLALLVVPSLMLAAGPNMKAREELSRIDALAREIRTDASTLDINYDLARATHDNYLTMMKENNNEIAKIAASLNKERPDLEPWQDEVLDRLLPRMEVMASEINSAIEYLNAHKVLEGRLTPLYRDYLHGIYDQSNSIVTSIDLYMDWMRNWNAMEKADDGS